MQALGSLILPQNRNNKNRVLISSHRNPMQCHLLDVVTVLAAGLMTGVELTVAAFLHPTLSRLPDSVHACAARAFARLFGGVMPFWYASVLLLSVIEVWVHWPLVSASARLLATASTLWLLTILFTLIFPVPINNRVASWNLNALPADWREQRRRWDRLHAIRVVALLVALTCLVTGVLTA
jgi:uncharacterized membrane protein